MQILGTNIDTMDSSAIVRLFNCDEVKHLASYYEIPGRTDAAVRNKATLVPLIITAHEKKKNPTAPQPPQANVASASEATTEAAYAHRITCIHVVSLILGYVLGYIVVIALIPVPKAQPLLMARLFLLPKPSL